MPDRAWLNKKRQEQRDEARERRYRREAAKVGYDLEGVSLEELVQCEVYARRVLGKELYPKQEAVLRDLNPRGARVALRAANGIGKTSYIVAPAVLWHAQLFPGSLTITTSGVFRQVKEQMWPEIRAIASRFSGMGVDVQQTKFTVKHDHGKESRVLGISSDESGKFFQGWHNEHLMIVLDEAAYIADGIFEAVERCQPHRVLMCSSPHARRGMFAKAWGEEAHIWKKHVIEARDVPHISEEWIQLMIQKWPGGEQHPLNQSMIFANWMDEGETRYLVREAWVRNVWENPPQHTGEEVVAFCDFAAGGDENALAIRRGNKVELAKTWREINTMAAVGEFVIQFKKAKLHPDQIYGDSGGGGHQMCDALQEAGWTINRVNPGSMAYDKEVYADRGTEIWGEGATRIERGEIILPHDDKLKDQLCNRRELVTSKGRLRAEPKEDMRRRGVRSPDRADAVLGAIVCGGHDVLRRMENKRVANQLLSVFSEEPDDGRRFAGFNTGEI